MFKIGKSKIQVPEARQVTRKVSQSIGREHVQPIMHNMGPRVEAFLNQVTEEFRNLIQQDPPELLSAFLAQMPRSYQIRYSNRRIEIQLMDVTTLLASEFSGNIEEPNFAHIPFYHYDV